MTVINSVFVAWVQYTGGIEVIHYTLSLLFIFVVLYVLLKITT